MSRRKQPELPAGVKQLGERIERWRRTRERRTAMPADLWSGAVALARSEGAYAIARALRLNFEGLKRRMAEAAAGRTGAAARSSAFVEWTGAQILGTASRVATVVELVDGAGNRLVVRLAPDAEVDVLRLIAAFRQRGDA
jgi:hypothetical protein